MTAGGSLVTFELAGGKPAAFQFLNALKLAVISNNLGDAKSLVTHPATTTHQRLTPEHRAQQGITEGMGGGLGRAGRPHRPGSRPRPSVGGVISRAAALRLLSPLPHSEAGEGGAHGEAVGG